MPLHPEPAALLQIMASTGAPALDSQEPAVARAAREALNKPSGISVPEVRDIQAGQRMARLYRPVEASATGPESTTGLLIWFHGGGWVLGSVESHDDLCRALCVRSGHSVLSVDYRLAPEDPFPAGLNDALDATRWAHANSAALGVDAQRIAIGGDSAGANLAAVVAQLAPELISHQVLIYPVTDARMGSDSYRENAEGYFLTASSMQWFCDHYLSGGEGSATDPRVSPLLGSDAALAATPPALVITAEFDPLRDEGDAYARRLADLGVTVTHMCFFGQIHGFYSFPEFIEDANLARGVTAEWLRTGFAALPD
jgi:acetyl esterase